MGLYNTDGVKNQLFGMSMYNIWNISTDFRLCNDLDTKTPPWHSHIKCYNYCCSNHDSP